MTLQQFFNYPVSRGLMQLTGFNFVIQALVEVIGDRREGFEAVIYYSAGALILAGLYTFIAVGIRAYARLEDEP